MAFASDLNQALAAYRLAGTALHWALLILACGGLACMFKQDAGKAGAFFMWASAAALGLGVSMACLLHLSAYRSIPLELPSNLATWFNQHIAAATRGESAPLPLYDPAHPPRFLMPPWLENEKFIFWFFCYAVMAALAYSRGPRSRCLRFGLQGLLVAQLLVLTLVTRALDDPLPVFFSEARQWMLPLSAPERLKLFMLLYPRMVFYYNAPYMWLHPPLLFLAYGAMSVFFAACVSMLLTGDRESELVGYTYARAGYLALTLGMLLGLPWALQAWGPNWWWDPKIASSIMMWMVFSTYLHARLYLGRKGMWAFAGWIGILCFAAMVFTVAASYLFPGQHTVH